MESLCRQVLKYHSKDDVIRLIRKVKENSLDSILYEFCKYFSKIYPTSHDILYEFGLVCYYVNKKNISAECSYKIINIPNIEPGLRKRCFDNLYYCSDYISNDYIYYPTDIVNKINNRNKKTIPLITFTVTTCKRFDLFSQTINSFLNCCLDLNLIDEWVCIDDNSSEEDREEMKRLYPFFTFYFKTIDEKGHPKSMNILQKMVNTPFIFHMEDDWKFLIKENYMTRCLDVLSQHESYGQCLINKNYSETAVDYNRVLGGIKKETTSGIIYYIHEYCNSPEQEKEWVKKHGYGNHCNYWPHYSLRPSLLKRQIFDDIGIFNENTAHFEMEYSFRYIAKGYVSVFLEHVYSLHIGRLTSQRNDPTIINAYKLNNETQFTGNKEQVEDKQQISQRIGYDFENRKFKTFVINLNSRVDRLNEFCKNNPNFLFERYSAIDGKKLLQTPQLKKLFEGNDYNMRTGMVGCALSHINIFIKLYYSEDDFYLILEDDTIILPNFESKIKHIFKQLPHDWDILYIGHHTKQIDQNSIKDELPTIEKWSASKSLFQSLGGTGSYLLSKRGSKNILDFIEKNGMTNGIDTVCQKSADDLNIYYSYPHLAHSECSRSDMKVDSDIQYDYSSVPKLLFDTDDDFPFRLYDGTTYTLKYIY